MPKISDWDVTDYLYDSVNIDEANIDEEMRRVGANMAYWNKRYGDAITAKLNTKLQAKIAESGARKRALTALQLDGEKTTDAAISAKAQEDEIWIAAQEAANEAEGLAAEIRGYADAVAAKKDMLMSLGAKLRREMEGDPVMRERHRHWREQREQNPDAAKED